MVAAVGRGVRWPVVATGVLVTGAPIGNAPAGSAEGRDQVPVCDETSQITMGFPSSCDQVATMLRAPKTPKSSGGIPRTSNQSN